MDSVRTSWTVAHQALLSMGFPRQVYWSGLPFPSLGDLPDPGIKPRSPALAGRFVPTEPPGKPVNSVIHRQFPRSILVLWLRTVSSGKLHTGCAGTLFFLHLLCESKIISQLKNGIKQRSVVLK